MSGKLDVESESDRQERLSRLFASTSAPAPPTRPTTFEVGPNTELLSRLRSFLPEIADANALLVDSNVEDLDIENVDEDEQYIEMDLGLGVFNARIKDGEDDSSDSGSSSEESSDEDEDGEPVNAAASEGASAGPTIPMLDLSRTAAPAKGKKPPGIEVLGEDGKELTAGPAA